MPTHTSPDRVVGSLLRPDEQTYLAYHRQRFEFTMELLSRHVADQERDHEPVSVFEIGPDIFTKLIEAELGDRVQVSTLGFASPRFMSDDVLARHTEFEFNDLQDRDGWPRLGPFDIVLFCEVLEHLWTAPSILLDFVAQCLRPGGIVILSTPNAVSLSKRIRMVRGRHPYEKLRETRVRPGHIREYTEDELREYLAGAGLAVDELWHNYYWPQHRIPLALSRLHPSLCQGFTVVARR